MESQPSNRLLASLRSITAEHPLERKLLLGRSPAQGRELLHALARAGTTWVGWEPVTLPQLAHELAAPSLAEDGQTVADGFDVSALIDEALDAVSKRGHPLASTLTSAGFRNAAQASVKALRDAGATPDQLLERSGEDGKLLLLGEILRSYEAALIREKLEDGAAIFRRAEVKLEKGADLLSKALIFVIPGLHLGGCGGKLLRRLLATGRATPLETDPVVGLAAPPGGVWNREAAGSTRPLAYLHAPAELPAGSAPPDLQLFAAATPVDELREVLRRVVARGIPWDQIELVTTDWFTYGPALDSLAQRLGIPVTHASGLPVERTRVGRAVKAYLQWISEGFAADHLRRSLEAGDLAPPREAEVSAAALARRLRRLQIGWGRDRYLEAVERALTVADLPSNPGDEEDPEESERLRQKEAQELRVLREMLSSILAAAPPTPDRLRRQGIRTSAAAVASGLLVFLEYVPGGNQVEGSAHREIRERLERVRQSLTRETGWESAVAATEATLGVRVAAKDDGSHTSWTSQGGRLHLADVASGGLCNRPFTFVVGMDATRVASSGAGDPLVTDPERIRLNESIGDTVPALPTTDDRLAESRFEFAAMLARLSGEVTLSYSGWDAAEGRSISAAPELLQALRLREGEPFLTYDDLQSVLGGLACAVPAGDACLDASDVWMRALAGDRVLLAGERLVREVFAGLDGGLRAAAIRGGDALTPYHGQISAEVAEEVVGGMIFSSTGLEALGTCPRKFLYRYVLGLRPTGDPEWDPNSWLNALSRGSLLHSVYERALASAREQAIDFSDDGFEALALGTLESEARAIRHRVPSPTERVFGLEMEQLRADVLLFVSMIRQTRPMWLELEYEFGHSERPLVLAIGGRKVELRGKIDRIDEVTTGALRVVDYKTGRANRYRPSAPFTGGRRVQHVLYLEAARQLLGRSPDSMEYHFPTARGENEMVPYSKESLVAGEAVLQALIDIAFNGVFVATADTSDCTYCDYGAICHAAVDDWGKTTCEVSEWSAKVGLELPEYRRFTVLRGIQ